MHAGGRTRVDTVRRGGSILAASDSASTSASAPPTSIDLLKVRWPDGSTSLFSADDLAVDATLTIRQDSTEVAARPFAGPAGARR